MTVSLQRPRFRARVRTASAREIVENLRREAPRLLLVLAVSGAAWITILGALTWYVSR